VDILRKTDLSEHGNLFTLAAALAMGLLPILMPGLYSKFPQAVQLVLGNGLAAGTLIAVLFNIIFHHLNFGVGKRAIAGEVSAADAPSKPS
ncbi:MAG: hypothetical protein JO000_25275, partial [Alphaproteobacteria bacterium]|nr:hypothetical protein [Alphaproteobacteria bacterium]